MRRPWANNTLSPGVYCGGLTIGNTNGTAFTLNPGTYIMAGGGMVLNSQAVVNGTGVTVYNTTSAGWGCASSYSYTPVTISGQVTATLSAPTSGTLNGILFFGNRSGCSTKGSCVDQINGGSTAVLNGALYFPSDEIAITGSNASGFLMLVADKIYINGNSVFGNNGDPFDGITVSVTPTTSTLFSAQTQQFTATVRNSANSAVTWSINPVGVGSISSTGLYSAPSIITSGQTVTVTATSQADTSKSGAASVTLAVVKTTPTITWATPSSITYGTALSATQLNATASVSGTFAYTPAAGAVLAAGSKTLSVTFTPTNTTLYNSATASVTLTVNRALLTVTAANASRVYAVANPSFTDTITGFVNGDNSSVVSGAPSLTTTATATSVPGSYPITAAAGTLSAANYSFSIVAGTLTVTTAAQTITFPAPTSPVTYGVSPITLSATSTSGLAVSFSVLSGPGTVSGNTLTITGAGTVVIAANQAGNADYAAAAQVTQSAVVNPAALTVTATNASRIYGVANPSFTDTITGFVNGDNSSVVSGAPSLLTTATATSVPGSYPITAAAGTLSAANYSFTFVNGVLSVTQATPIITWATPAAITYGTALSSAQLDVTASVAGTFVYTPAAGTVLTAGSHTLSVVFTPTDTADYATPPAQTAQLTVNKATLTVTASSASVSYGSAVPPITPSYSGFVNGDSAASLTTVPTCSTIYTVGSARGTYPTTCSSAVDANYSTGYMAGTVTVTTGSQTINFTPPVTPVNYGVQPITLSATASSGLTVTITVLSGPGTVSGNTLTITGAGTVVVAANQAGNADYAAATEVTQTIVVNIAPSFTEVASSLNPSTYGQNVTFSALVSTGGVSPTGSISFTDNSTEINSTTVTPVQTTNLVADSQANAAAWTSDETGSAAPIVAAYSGLDPFGGTNALQMAFPAPSAGTSDSFNTVNVSGAFAGQTFTASVWLSAPSATTINLLLNEVGGSSASASNAVKVGSAWQRYSVSLPIPAADSGASSLNLVLVNPSGQPAATINVFGAQVENATMEGPYVATYGTALSGYGAIASFATSTLTPGSHPITAAYAGDANDAASTSVTLIQVVNDATAALSLAASTNSVVYGNSVTFTATISNSLTGTVTFYDGTTAIGTSALSSGSATLTASALAAGSHAITAAWAGNADYNSVTSAPITLLVNQATPTIAWASPAAITYGTALSATQLNATASVAGAFVSSPVTGTVLSAGLQTLSVTFIPTDSTDYSTATASVTLTVNKATPTISWATPAAITYGTALSSTQLDATASMAGTFVYSPAAGTALPAGSQTLSATFTPNDTTDYSAATATVPLQVNQATPVVTWATPAAITSGTALSSTQLDATANVPGTFVYSPAAGTVPSVGSQTLSVIFTPTDTTDYNTTTASIVLTVNPATSCAGNGYSFGRAITINHSLVPNTDQTNFPFLFNTTDPLLATTANSGHVSNLNGHDIVFTSDAAGQNPLSYEMEEYNPQTGQVIAWVQIPTVSHSQDTTVYLFYGNPNITTSQQNPTGVWDANYLGVWHVANNGGQLSLADSTSNQNNATNNGATATAGQIDGGMATNGTNYATVGTLPNLENTLSGTATYSVWVNPSFNTPYGGIFGENWPGWSIGVYGGGGVEVELSAEGVGIGASITPNTWSNLTVTITQIAQADGTQVSYGSLYINGILNQSYSGNPVADVQQTLEEYPTVITYLGLGPAGSGNQSAAASEDEFRISNIARSSDWIATEYANQSSPSTFYNFSPEGIVLNTYSVSLYQGQTQQFTASFPGNCSGPVSWSISPAGSGTIDQTGLYTAPASITTQQTVTVTATSGSTFASATVTLIPAVAVSVTPATAAFTNNGGQQQQFTATVVNTSNTVVSWSISPSGAGTIDQTGLYTAPETIASQQTVTVTATSQFDPTKSASATITLTSPSLPPPICASNGYSFMRPIVINHNLVPNTDQAHFPFLFNTTDPAFATTGNGGHMANINTYDLIFSTDPAGQNLLNYEVEKYNPFTGQIIAWIQVPDLSHTADTVLYMFYGNAAIASSQQNPTGVWDSNFMGVWHVANPNGQLSLSDSTSNSDNATNNWATATGGEIDGGMSSLNYGYATIGAPANLANLAHGNATFSAWVNPAVNPSGGTGNGIILGKGGFYNDAGWSFGVNNQGQLGFIVYDSNNAWNCCYSYPINTNPLSSGWNLVAATIAPDPATPSQDLVTLYVNGAPSGSGTVTINNLADDSWLDALLANNLGGKFDYYTWGAFNGSEDEFRISNIVRSPDWIATEYNNQSSPSSFYQLYSENQQGIIPSATTLYASQAAQFTDVSGCGAAAVNWSLPAGSPGILTAGGLYSAPSSIATQQAISITATSQANGSNFGTSVVNLLPPMSLVSVSPAAPTLYAANETIQFTATLSNAVNSAVTWSVSPAFSGSITETGFYTAPGPMSFPISTQTVTITATSVQDPTQSASATLTLMPVVVNPSVVYIYGGFSQQFTANIPVVWSLGPGAIGSVSQTGLYTAPLNGNTRSQGSYWATFYLYATPQVDPNASGTAWIGVQPPIIQPVTPAAVSLYSGQSEAFNVCLATSATSYGCQSSNGQTVANWSISPASAGTISTSGVYTAPQWSPNQQTVTVTATDVANPAITSTGTITLLPPAVSITPQSVTLYPDQNQQFTAVVTNSSITAVTWSISPAGAGSISSSGVYSAPFTITSQQTVTVTVASQEYPSVTASVVITLLPTQCPGKAYSYVRPIVIDHTKVPISDQDNFPFYFAVADPSLASTSNGGQVTSTTGNDIVFSSDPAGLQPLPFDLEQYNPATGQIVAWVKLPVLSHSQDTVIYMFYGNTSIIFPQQNPVAVWDTNYTAVYQFENLQNGALSDSTINANNALSTNVQEIPGQSGAAGAFDGATSYVTLPANDFPSYPDANPKDIIAIGGDSSAAVFNTSFAVWFKTTSSGVILGQTDGTPPGGNPNGSVPELYIDTNGYLRANLFYYQYLYGTQSTPQQIVSPTTLNDGNWHYAVVTFDTDAIQNTWIDGDRPVSTTIGTETLYVDGQVIGQQSGAVPGGYNLVYSYYLGTGYAPGGANTSSNNNNWFYYNGSLDEIEISSTARSSGWVQAEYNNQSSPSTFFMLGTEAGVTPSLNPLAVTLYESQSQQFNVLQTGLCSAGDAVWSLSAGSPGTLAVTGLYTAPATINTKQTVTVTATTLGASSTQLSATITLMPPVAVTVTPGMAALPTGGTQQFTATVANTTNTAVTWTLEPSGVGSISSTGLYTAPATLNGQQTVSVIATSVADPTQSASATVTLGIAAPPVSTISISIDPQTAMLYASETHLFTATVINTTNTAVTWSVSPAGAGTIDANGLYSAPATISAQQTVTITATSQANSSVTAMATVDLLPAQCASNGYSYLRAITVDHTKIPNTDQTNFPFLFSATDPLLATSVNGGHIANPNGYDIIFTSDSSGQTPLNYEIEEYNPTTGQIVAWVQIPDLSHTSDTVIYLFYGNSNITVSQQNPTGTWDSSFQAVWHLPNGTTLSANDSTANANNGTITDVAPTTGKIDGGAVFNGSTSQITCGSNVPGFQFTAAQSFTDSAWFKMPTTAGGPMSTSLGWMSILSSSDSGLGHGLEISQTTGVFSVGDNGIGPGYSDDIPFTLSINTWHYMVGVQNGGTGHSLYIDGVLVASDQNTYNANPGGTCTIGNGGQLSRFEGSIDEVRIASAARSADWVAAEYANQNSPSTFFALSSENEAGITPNAVALYANQSQQFVSPSLCSGAIWSLSPGSQGTLTSSGLYTAPGTITGQQAVTVTATSQTNSGQSATATVTLMPPVSVTVSPASITLNQNQSQQFTATVNNSISQTVIWTMNPTGLGSLDQNGGYIAPSSIATQQTVTITATSVFDPSKSASAMVTLAPSTRASTGYGYQHVIVIDHTKVAYTDQINFPFLFNSTDPDLATVDHGGNVANPNGYDIIFSTDPNGQTKLDFEIEQYNPATGQLVAWMRIPTLSHSSDTVIYVFYGNPAITISQANPAGVWDTNYQAVYHLGALPVTGVASDSTGYVNNAAFIDLTANPGQIDGAAKVDGSTSFLEIPATAFPNYPTGVYSNIGVNTTWQNTSFDATYSMWFKTSSWGGLLDQTAWETCTSEFFGCYGYGPELPSENPDGSWGSLLDINFDGYLEGRSVGPSTQVYNDNNWHYAAITFENGVNDLYADGQLVATGSQGTFGYASGYAYFVGAENVESDTSSLDSQPWKYLPGQIDEINVSNTARSGDWIQTQFNNQCSPSTFYKFYSQAAVQVAPSSISLYAAQSEQFTVPGASDSNISWSIPAGSLGAVSSTGLYTAPSVVSNQQAVTVSAVSQSNGTSFGSAQVTLLPTPQPLTLVASSQSPYQVGTTQSFTAKLLDPQGNPQIGVTVNFTVAGVNGTIGSATTNTSGAAIFTYTGSNSGTDTVQATASVDGSLLTSNSLAAAWITPPPAQAPTVTLLAQPSLGRGALIGAFTDDNGDLIEPIALGIASRTFITPAGATRLQLGTNDNYYEDNGGAGFVVAVNGFNVSVPATAMPWNWKTGGLNNNYQYGINDGTSPVIAAASLTTGQPVTVAYKSGTISTNYPINASVSANGDSSFITGTQIFQGAYFPTLYTTEVAYPQNQPLNIFATVVDASGAPIPNTPVTINISGANPGQYQATTDASGTASFFYTGEYAGNDSLQAQATLAGQGTLDSNTIMIDWTNYPTPPPVGSLSLDFILNVVNSQRFSSFARDASGNPLPNVNVGFYVTGVDNFQSSSSTNEIGQAGFAYYHTQSGNYSVIAVDSVDRNVIVTQPYTGYWTVPTGSPSATGGTITVGISANTTVAMPNALTLTGTATDSAGDTPTVTWVQVSGPGTVTFANPNQASTTATFSQDGTYVLQLSATDTVNSGWAQFTVTVVPPSIASEVQGWVGSPAYGSTVSGIVPITLAPGVTLASGTLMYAPVNNPSNVTMLNANVSGSGQIGTLDTTMMANGPYMIQMQATDTSGNFQYSLVLVTISGNYKPGRLTTTVADLVVPANGLPINIQRSYDSLNAGTNGDFGYGWNLGINVNLTVDPKGNVTFTLGGQRKTFYFTPKLWFPNQLIYIPWYFPDWTPEPGLHGSLSWVVDGNDATFFIIQPDSSIWEIPNGIVFSPDTYIYTDPNGTAYWISASGQLQFVQDKNGNVLYISSSGITSSTGISVPIVRDAQNRVIQITDPQGNIYSYGYDTNGNLATVQYPNSSTPTTYSYDANHHYLSGTDQRGNPLPTTQYYQSTVDSSGQCQGDCDPNGVPLNNRLKSVTDALGETKSYAYVVSTTSTINGISVPNTGLTTITYPTDPADGNGQPGSATMIYDSLGNLLQSTDPLGHVTTNTYDANRNLLSTTDPLGHTTSYTYDANGNKTSTTYPATATRTNTTSYTSYNQYSERTSTTDELGNTRTTNYDGNYNPASVTDPLGTLFSFQFNANGTLAAGAKGFDITQSPARASQFTYDAWGDRISKTDALGRTTTYAYDALGRKTSMTKPPPAGSTAAAATTTYQYDALGHLTQTSAPLGRVTSSQYDANGNKISDTDARGYTTQYKYDALNRLTETDYPDGTTAAKTYDFRNNVVTETDRGGHVTLHQYDLAGRQIAVTTAYGTANATATSYAYDNAGRLTSETDALGHTTNYTSDAAGNMIAVSGVAGNFTFAYDNAQNPIAMTDGNNNTTQFQYDARNRLTVTTYPDGTTKTKFYDSPSNLRSITDQANHQVQYNYDAANQLTSVVQVASPDTNANTTSYGYDTNGNPIALEDANTDTTTQYFDVLNELTQKTLPDGSHTETRTYDSNGNLASVTHFNGVTTTYTYDVLNRPLSRATPGEGSVSFAYTQTGKYLNSTYSSGSTTNTDSYTYDSMDRIQSKVTPEGTLNYTYDSAGNVASISSSNLNGASMSYTYDDLNRLATVTDNRLAGNNVTTYTYDNASNVATVTLPNGVQSSFTYDTLNRVKGLSSQPASYTYQRGPTGNLLSGTESSGRQVNWSYDGIYRLTNETVSLAPSQNNGAVSYGLDPVGNRLSESSSLPGVASGSWTFNSDDQISSETYDANGNVIAAGGKTFSYDSQNKLVSMNGGVASIVYDAFGERVAKSVNGVVTRYLVEDDVNPTGLPQVFDELNGAGQVARAYAYGLQRVDEEQVLNGALTPSFYGYDGGGNVAHLTDATGKVTDSYEYDAFGNSFTVSGTTPNNYLYRGEQFDSDLGLYYLRARYYNPASGRFYSRDPKDGRRTNPQSLHKYLYANGDPVNGIDPMGREDEAECAAVSAAGGCAALPVTTGLPTAIIPAAAEAGEVAVESAVEGLEVAEEESAEVAGEEAEEEELAEETKTDCSKFGVPDPSDPRVQERILRNKVDEFHHIVSQRAEGALNIRPMLNSVRIAIDSAINIVKIPWAFHSFLNVVGPGLPNDTYYDTVEESIQNALDEEGNEMENVTIALSDLSKELKECGENYR